MKLTLFISLFLLGFCIQAQTDDFLWKSEYSTALKAAANENKPILLYTVNGMTSSESQLIENEFLQSDEIKKFKNTLVFLKLNVTNDGYAKRIAKRYTKNSVPAIALIDSKQSPIGEPLTRINSENISNYIKYLKTKIL